MSRQQDKALVLDFLRASIRHDATALSAMMTDDATYWVQGKSHLFPYAGEKTKEEICRYFATPSVFKDGLALRVGSMTAEDDRIAVETEVDGVAPNGKRYNNTFHYLFVLREGKIARVKEYFDSYHAAEIFLDR